MQNVITAIDAIVVWKIKIGKLHMKIFVISEVSFYAVFVETLFALFSCITANFWKKPTLKNISKTFYMNKVKKILNFTL